MALLFIDSFDHYATANLLQKWTALGTSPTITTGGRHGSRLSCTGSYVQVTCLGGISSAIVGVALKVADVPGSGVACLVAMGSATTWECGVIINSDSTIQAARASSASAVPGGSLYWTALGSPSSLGLSTDVWYYLEVKFVIGNSPDGRVTVRINGVEWLDVTGVDTQLTSATGTRVGLGSVASENASYDDLYIASTSGGTVTDFIGDCTVEAILPQTDAVDAGTNAGWTCSTGSDHGALVDESTPNESDYVSADTNVKDTWNYPNLSVSNATIHGVQVNSFAKKSTTGTGEFKNLARVTTTDHQGTNTHAPSDTGYAYFRDVWEVNPDDSSAWTVSDINGAEFGVERTA